MRSSASDGPRADGVPDLRQPTMADVAAELGVSRQLVSLVLSGKPGASAATRERVQEAAERIGYRPHRGAQLLRQSASHQLGVLFAPAHATEPDIVEAIYPAAGAQGYQVLLSATTPTRSGREALEELLSFRCAALVAIGSDLAPSALAALARRASVPLVAVGAGRRNAHYDVVRSAGDVGIAACVTHLIELGHRDIAYVHATSMPPAGVRRRGYLRAMARHGLTTRVLEYDGDYTEESGAQAARALLALPDLPTAVVLGNDQAATGLMITLARQGVSIPGDVSVTGFDDSRFARLSAVDLTTARQDPVALGEAAVAAAVRRIADPSAVPQEIVVTPLLVVRSSSGVPRN